MRILHFEVAETKMLMPLRRAKKTSLQKKRNEENI